MKIIKYNSLFPQDQIPIQDRKKHYDMIKENIAEKIRPSVPSTDDAGELEAIRQVDEFIKRESRDSELDFDKRRKDSDRQEQDFLRNITNQKFIDDQNKEHAEFMDLIRRNIKTPHRGLLNCGATCYINSLLQMFSYIPEFIDDLYILYMNQANYKLRLLYLIIKNLYDTTKSELDRPQLLYNFSSIFNNTTSNINRQADAGEFILPLLQNMDTSTFKFSAIEEKICERDMGVIPPSTQAVESYYLSLESFLFENNSSISQLISKQLQPTSVQARNCIPQVDLDALERRKQQIRNEGNRNRIPEADIIKAIQKIESESPTDTMWKKRLLNMTNNNYLLIAVQRMNTGEMVNIEYNIRIKPNDYILEGIILRSGNITATGYSGGHYRYLKVIDKSNGILYNDSVVTNINNPNLLNIKEYKEQGYLFLYKNPNFHRPTSMAPIGASIQAAATKIPAAVAAASSRPQVAAIPQESTMKIPAATTPAAEAAAKRQQEASQKQQAIKQFARRTKLPTEFKYKYLKYKIKYHNLLKENNIE